MSKSINRPRHPINEQAVTIPESGNASITTISKKGGDVVSEESRVLSTPQDDVIKPPVAYVTVGASHTHNLGNYNSLRVECSVTLPCDATDDAIQITCRRAANLVDSYIAAELDQVTNISN